MAAFDPLRSLAATDYDAAVISVWLSIVAAALALGFGVAHVRNPRTRQLSFGALLAAPLLIFTVIMAWLPPASPGFWAWWAAGVFMISPAILAWAVLSTVAYLAGRRSVR